MKILKSLILSGSLILTTLASVGQDCDDVFINDLASYEICNKGWKITNQRGFIILKSANINLSIVAEWLPDSEENPDAFSFWQQSVDEDKEKYKGLEVISCDTLNIGEAPVCLGVTRVPSAEEAVQSKQIHFITAVFFHNGFRYSINNNCYLSDCSANIDLVKQVVAAFRFSDNIKTDLSELERQQAEEFGKKLFIALQKGDKELFEALVISKPVIIDGIKTRIRDVEVREMYVEILEQNWEEAFALFVKSNEEAFHKLVKSGSKRLSQATFDSFMFELEESQLGLLTIKGKLVFTHKKQEYFIDVPQVMLLADGWYIIEIEDKIE